MDQIKKHQVQFFSSNYTLYGDISSRVMQTLEEFTPNLEVYSIEEAFLDMSGFSNREEYAQKIRATVYQHVGVPVCVGIAPTKTLAKLAASKPDETHRDKLMQAVDTINHSGQGQIWFGGQRPKRDWFMKQTHLSPAYTTRWDCLPLVGVCIESNAIKKTRGRIEVYFPLQ